LNDGRLSRQIDFVREADRLKTVYRQTLLMDGSRYENDAEHSWHVCLMAALLHEHAGSTGVDLLRVLKMLLVHDIVEIDAGDTYCYDEEAHRDKAERERAAADRLFALLPEDQAGEVRALWEEFEGMGTPEARFAAALDRLQPLLHNYFTRGEAWRRHGVRPHPGRCAAAVGVRGKPDRGRCQEGLPGGRLKPAGRSPGTPRRTVSSASQGSRRGE
jgi:putative hydrolase of HD superfamily